MVKINGNSSRFKVFVLSTMCAAGILAFYLDDSADSAPILLTHPPRGHGGAFTPPPVARLLNLDERAERLETLMRENGITDSKAIVCLLATAKHESSFNSRTVYREKNGSISRGVFQFNSRGLGRGIPPEKLHAKEFQVKSLVSLNEFRQWYGETKTKNYPIETAMRELTRRIIRCAKVHYSARIATAKTWWKKLESGGNKGDS